MRWVALIVGFLMLFVPAFGRGSNIAGLVLSWGGGVAGIFIGGAVSILFMDMRLRRRRVDKAAATLFGILGIAAMVAAPFVRGVVASLLPDSEAWYGVFDTLWLLIPSWLIYGFMVGFGMAVVLLGSKRVANDNARVSPTLAGLPRSTPSSGPHPSERTGA